MWETPKEMSNLNCLIIVFRWMKKGTRDEQLKEKHPGKVSRNKMFTLIYCGCVNQRTTCRSQFFSTMGILVI